MLPDNSSISPPSIPGQQPGANLADSIEGEQVRGRTTSLSLCLSHNRGTSTAAPPGGKPPPTAQLPALLPCSVPVASQPAAATSMAVPSRYAASSDAVAAPACRPAQDPCLPAQAAHSQPRPAQCMPQPCPPALPQPPTCCLSMASEPVVLSASVLHHQA